MTWPPPDLEWAAAENAAATAIRQLSGILLSWEQMIATAQVVTSHADDVATEQATMLHDQEAAAPLIAAARILDAAADARSQLDPDERRALAILAVIAYGMHGNFASAHAVAARSGLLSLPEGAVGPSLAAALGVALPNDLAALLPHAPDGTPSGRFLRQYLAFLESGTEERQRRTAEVYRECLVPALDDGFLDASALRLAGLALKQAFILSVPRLLRQQGVLPAEVLQNLVSRNYRVFLPPQYQAIAQKGLLTSDDNSMIALPTSTGKTLLGTLCLLAALRDEPGLVCYVTPWVATARQAADAFQRIKPTSARVLRLMGGYEEHNELAPYERQEIAVATPERFDALLRGSPELLPALRAAVFDEAHLVQNASRGVRLEGLVARLRMMQDRGADFRLVFTSAVLAPDVSVQNWLCVPDGNALIDTWRPTARRVARWTQPGRLEWFTGDDVIRRPGTDPSSVIGFADLPWPEPGIHWSRTFGGQRAQQPQVNANVAYLVDWAARGIGWPILCVCGTKAQTRDVAAAIAARYQELDPMPTSVARIRARIGEAYPYLRPLAELVTKGIAYHNSTVPHDVRELIEDAVANRDLRVVAATTTLAEGVDLPFRVTVIVNWLMYSADGLQPMTATLFANIAGRAGRANSFTDGDTILFDNPVGDPEFTHPGRRARVQAGFLLADRLPHLTSAFESTQEPQRNDLRAALASQLLAAIPESPGEDDLVGELLSHTLVGSRVGANGRRSAVAALLEETRAEVLGGDDVALAVANSPLSLTPLGVAANRTGFSPTSVVKLVQQLRAEPPSLDVADVGTYLLRNLGTVPEQPNQNLKKVLTTTTARFVVKPDDLGTVISEWITGIEPERIFAALPTVGRSTIRPPIEDWLAGEVAPKWDDRFDTFVDFASAVLVGFLPWLFRASEVLSGFAPGWAVLIPWREWAERLESRGTDDPVPAADDESRP